MSTIKIIVSGRVQGVFYRLNTLKKAKELGLLGTVRNLADGSVEIIAKGGQEIIEQLIDWSKKGPSLAKVDKVSFSEIEPETEYQDFSII